MAQPPTDPNCFIANTELDGYSPIAGHKHLFVPAPEENTLDYNSTPPALFSLIGMKSLPMRIRNGEWKTRGIAHMLHKHHAAIAMMGYYSIQDYVLDVCRNFDRVYRGKEGKWIISIAPGDEPRERLLVLHEEIENVFCVVTGWPQSPRKPVSGELIAIKKETLIWECCASILST